MGDVYEKNKRKVHNVYEIYDDDDGNEDEENEQANKNQKNRHFKNENTGSKTTSQPSHLEKNDEISEESHLREPAETAFSEGSSTVAQGSTDRKEESTRACKPSQVYENRAIVGGTSAGRFLHQADIHGVEGCVKRCCSVDTCNLVVVSKGACFLVTCKSVQSCALSKKKKEKKEKKEKEEGEEE